MVSFNTTLRDVAINFSLRDIDRLRAQAFGLTLQASVTTKKGIADANTIVLLNPQENACHTRLTVQAMRPD